MSERSSYVSDYIYCPKCFRAAEAVLSGVDKYLCGGPIAQRWLPDDAIPIVAGKHGGLGADDDHFDFAAEMIELRDKICHPLRVMFLPESWKPVLYWLKPNAPIRMVMVVEPGDDPASLMDEDTVKRRTGA